MKLVGDRREGWIGRGEEPRGTGLGDVEEEDLFLPLEDAEQPAAGDHLPVGREPDVVKLVPGRPGFRKGRPGEDLAVARRAWVEVHHREEVRRGPRLIAGTDVEVARPVRTLPLVRWFAQRGIGAIHRRYASEQDETDDQQSPAAKALIHVRTPGVVDPIEVRLVRVGGPSGALIFF